MKPVTRMIPAALLFGLINCTFMPSRTCAGEVEVLHFWASGAEARAVAKLKATLRSEGDTWRDFAVADGGGGLAVSLLRSRVNSGNPPTAAQIKGIAIQEWARPGTLASIDDVARADNWDAALPGIVSDAMKYKGQYVAVPLNVHRVNWLWVNAEVLKRTNAKLPVTWDDFFALADAMRRLGVTPVAYSGQSWLDLGIFESVVIGVGGPDFYKKAFLDLDPAALNNPLMEKSLATYKRIKQYTDRSANGRDWVTATKLLSTGRAGMLIMGDWAKPEMVASHQRPGIDILCTPTPGSGGAFSFDIDSFVMFHVGQPNRKAQRDLARAVMSREFQQDFNLAKGSIPVRLDVGMDRFDDCAKRARQDFQTGAKRGMLLPSLAHGMAQPAPTVSAMWDVIRQFWNQDGMTPRDAMLLLVAAAKRSRD
jgi:glucose/mannose transport system substrate-binding protein